MESKNCFKCGEPKPLSEFYKHKQMADGHLNKCKSCSKKDASEHRQENLEKIRAYDKERGARQGKVYLSEYRKKYPNKAKAHRMVNYHKNAGNLKQMPCEVCGKQKVVGHHDDYSQPLNVRWLCQAHHKQWHAKNGEGKNAI